MAQSAATSQFARPGNDAGDTVGNRLTRAREARGLTKSQLARGLGVKTQTLHGWEAGRNSPRANRLTMLAGVLNVSPTWILTGHGEDPVPNGDDTNGENLEDGGREGLLRLRDSISAKIAELNRILSEVENKLEN